MLKKLLKNVKVLLVLHYYIIIYFFDSDLVWRMQLMIIEG